MAVHRRAFALILVLVAVSATFALAVQGAVALRTTMAESNVMRRSSELSRQAQSAAAIVFAALTSGDPLRVDRAGSSGSATSSQAPAPTVDDSDLPEMPPEMKDFLIGVIQRQKADQPGGPSSLSPDSLTSTRTGGAYAALKRHGLPTQPLVVTLDNERFHVSAIDAMGGLNINTADKDQLKRYFRARGIVEPQNLNLADEILDWRDEDNVPRSRGAERSIYQNRGITIRNGDFESVDELLYLPSMTRELLDSIRQELTIVGDGMIHAGSASFAVLMSAPDMTQEAARRIIAKRQTEKLDSDSLKEALGGLSRDAAALLRLQPSTLITLRLEPESGGAARLATALISDQRGVTGLTIRMASQ